MDCIYIAPLSKALYNVCLSFTHSPVHTHIHTPTAIGCHARYQPARQEQLGVRCPAQGHFDTPRVGSNRQPSNRQTTALTSWATSPRIKISSNLRLHIVLVLNVIACITMHCASICLLSSISFCYDSTFSVETLIKWICAHTSHFKDQHTVNMRDFRWSFSCVGKLSMKC